jgi:hypothetical protein
MPLIHRALDGTERVIADRYCDRHDPWGHVVGMFASLDDDDPRCPVCRGEEADMCVPCARTEPFTREMLGMVVPISQEVLDAPMPEPLVPYADVRRAMARELDKELLADMFAEWDKKHAFLNDVPRGGAAVARVMQRAIDEIFTQPANTTAAVAQAATGAQS